MKANLISNIQWEDVKPEDYPDFVDAYAVSFDYDGREATDEEIDYFNDNLISDFHHSMFNSLL